MKTKLIQTKDYLLLINEEAEIKENLWSKIPVGGYFYSKIREEVVELQPRERNYDPSGFEIIAYYHLTKEAKELDLPLLPLVGLETEEGKIWKEDGVFVYLQNGKKYKKSELELWVENT